MLHWCDCCQYHRQGSDSSSNSSNICREWEDNDLLLTATCTPVIHGLLLWETMAVALTTTVALVVVGEHALLLSGSLAAAWGLLVDIHAELDVYKLVLHCD